MNLIDRTVDRIDAIHRRIPPVAVVFGVLKKYGDDRGGQLAMLLAYRGFFSLFPLLLAFVNVVGLLLVGNPEMREDLIDSTLASVPVVGEEIKAAAGAAGGSELVVVLSVLVSLWAGLGLLEMLQEVLNTVWSVPVFRRPPWILRKLRSLPGAILIGACLVLSGASAWLFDDPGVSLPEKLAAYLLPFLAGALCYLGLHWLLCARKVPLVAQVPGAAFVGAAWLVLQVLGTWYIDRFVLQSLPDLRDLRGGVRSAVVVVPAGAALHLRQRAGGGADGAPLAAHPHRAEPHRRRPGGAQPICWDGRFGWRASAWMWRSPACLAENVSGAGTRCRPGRGHSWW